MKHPVLLSALLILAAYPVSGAESLFTLPAKTRPLQVALYTGPGASDHGVNSVSDRIKELPQAAVTLFKPAEFATRDLKGFDLVVFSGGSGSTQAKAIGPVARGRVREFVRGGGGYLGICAGAYLACAGFDWSVGILNAKTVSSHWQRGQATMQIQLSDPGRGLFGDVSAPFPIRYHNGPIIEPLGRTDLPAYQVGAVFRTELVGTHGAPAGKMVGSPAVAYAPFGKGRVVIISPHSEDTPGLENFIPRAVAWATASAAD